MSCSFIILALVTTAGAVAALVSRRLVHCALFLIFAFGGLGGLYLGLGAQFAGLAQILVYVGAVSILVVFTILLTRGEGVETGRRFGESLWPGLFISASVAALLWWAICRSRWLASGPPANVEPTVRDIGDRLMTTHAVPLEAVGALLTAALIGAVILALPEGRKK